MSVRGAVVQRSLDPRKESPITDAEVTATVGSTSARARTDSTGYFSMELGYWIRRGQPIRLAFRREGYEPLEFTTVASDQLLVARMVPLPSKVEAKPNQPEVALTNVRIRYSSKTTNTMSVGSAAKSFEVVNTPNILCSAQESCSPDGKWKASVASISLDAGEGNEFRNVRLSCIAGPCPFSKIDSDNFGKGGRHISALVRNWSDTVTYLLEAEVYHPMEGELMQNSYPVIFGRTMNFSVPKNAEGISIESDMNGESIVFPLGPAMCLSWADCSMVSGQERNNSYRCELKPGYRFSGNGSPQP